MPVTLYRLRYKPAKSIGNGKWSLLGLYHWWFRFDLQYQAFAALALSFVNMKKKNIAWNTDVSLTSHWVCLHLPSSREMFYCIPLVILRGASCMFFAGLMLEKVGACGLSITHRISRQKVETPEDISFPQLKLCGSSSRSYQLWFTTVHCRVGGQDLQSTKPAGRNSCWNSQNSGFFPDIQHPLCFQWELLSLVLIACSPQPSPHPCFSDFTVPPLLSSLPCSSLPPFSSHFRFSSTWAFLPSRSTAASSAQLLLKFLSLL